MMVGECAMVERCRGSCAQPLMIGWLRAWAVFGAAHVSNTSYCVLPAARPSQPSLAPPPNCFQSNVNNGHGALTQITEQQEFFAAAKRSDKLIVIFSRNSNDHAKQVGRGYCSQKINTPTAHKKRERERERVRDAYRVATGPLLAARRHPS